MPVLCCCLGRWSLKGHAQGAMHVGHLVAGGELHSILEAPPLAGSHSHHAGNAQPAPTHPTVHNSHSPEGATIDQTRPVKKPSTNTSNACSVLNPPKNHLHEIKQTPPLNLVCSTGLQHKRSCSTPLPQLPAQQHSLKRQQLLSHQRFTCMYTTGQQYT